jgi:hypothetical protein
MPKPLYAITYRADGWHARLLTDAVPGRDRVFASLEEAITWCHSVGGIVEEEPSDRPGITIAPEDPSIGEDVRTG